MKIKLKNLPQAVENALTKTSPKLVCFTLDELEGVKIRLEKRKNKSANLRFVQLLNVNGQNKELMLGDYCNEFLEKPAPNRTYYLKPIYPTMFSEISRANKKLLALSSREVERLFESKKRGAIARDALNELKALDNSELNELLKDFKTPDLIELENEILELQNNLETRKEDLVLVELQRKEILLKREIQDLEKKILDKNNELSQKKAEPIEEIQPLVEQEPPLTQEEEKLDALLSGIPKVIIPV